MPMGWKRHRDQVWCSKCWHQSWMMRAVTVPVAGPVDATWEELRASLQLCWQDATRVANWAVSEMAKAEVPRMAGDVKMSTCPSPYLYPGARDLAPKLGTRSVIALLQAVEKRYRKRRLAAIWRRAESLPSYRYPLPLPIHNEAWSLGRNDGGAYVVQVPLAEGRRFSMHLRGGDEFRRQLAMMGKITSGECPQGELSIYQRSGSSGDHRPNGVGREPSRLLVKMCAWFPKHVQQGASGTLYVRTGNYTLWTYRVGEDGEPSVYHADQVRRWIAEYDRRMQRLADDTKHEKRWPARVRRGMAMRRQAWVEKQHNRMDSWTHEATAMLAGVAIRRRVACVHYDDLDRSYLDHAPWAQLRDRLAYKLAAAGIELTFASGEVVDKAPWSARRW